MAGKKFAIDVVTWMHLLRGDFALSVDDAAAIFGNVGHESAGGAKLQELNPRSGRGGYGWPQWTGPRRRAYEAYCRRHGYDPAEPLTNYKYLFVELHGAYSGAIVAVKKAATLAAKVKAFELAYERAGVKHYASRENWANIAKGAYLKAYTSGETELPAPNLPPPQWETNPVQRWAINFITGLIVSRITKAMEGNKMDILSGYKTYIVAILMVLVALATLIGIEIPAVDPGNAGQIIMEALAILFLRKGIATNSS